MSLGLSVDDAEKLLDNYDIELTHITAEKLLKKKSRDRGILKSDLLSMVEGVRLAFASVQTKKGATVYNRWYKKQVSEAKKLLGIKEPTIWDSMGGKSRRL